MNRPFSILILLLFVMVPQMTKAQWAFDFVSVEAYINDHKKQRSLLLARSTLELSNQLLHEYSSDATVEYKTLKGEKGGTGKQTEEKKDLLDNIIDKINIMYHGNFTEADKVIVESIYDAMQKETKKLTKQAKNSDVNMFAQNIFPKVFEKIAQDCYVQQMDSFAKLFEEPSFYKHVMEEMARAMYFNLKNGDSNN